MLAQNSRKRLLLKYLTVKNPIAMVIFRKFVSQSYIKM